MAVLLDAVRNDASRRDVAPVTVGLAIAETPTFLGGVALRKIVIPPQSRVPKVQPECWRAALQTLVDVDTAVAIPDFLRFVPDASARDVADRVGRSDVLELPLGPGRGRAFALAHCVPCLARL
jgi:hypothetical protein